MDYELKSDYSRLKREYENIILHSRDRKLVAQTKLKLKLLEQKYKSICLQCIQRKHLLL